MTMTIFHDDKAHPRQNNVTVTWKWRSFMMTKHTRSCSYSLSLSGWKSDRINISENRNIPSLRSVSSMVGYAFTWSFTSLGHYINLLDPVLPCHHARQTDNTSRWMLLCSELTNKQFCLYTFWSFYFLLLVACYATLHPALRVRPSVG